MKKKPDRSQVKNPGLNKHYNSKVRQEFMDQDYIKKLSPEEKAFLSKFNTEYYGADLDFKNLENNLHNTPELKKDCTDRNNKQNNDVYGVSRATGRLITGYNPAQDESETDEELEEESDDLL